MRRERVVVRDEDDRGVGPRSSARAARRCGRWCRCQRFPSARLRKGCAASSRTRADRYALLFAAGELHREVVQPVAEPDAMQQSRARSDAPDAPRSFEWHLHVLERVSVGRAASSERRARLLHPGAWRADPRLSAARSASSRKHLTTRRDQDQRAGDRVVCCSRRPDDRDEGTLRDAERDVAQGRPLLSPRDIFGEVPGKEHVA